MKRAWATLAAIAILGTTSKLARSQVVRPVANQTAKAAPSKVIVTGAYERFRRVRVHVTAPLERSGQIVQVLDGKRVIGTSFLLAQVGQSVADIVLPMPQRSLGYGTLPIWVNGIIETSLTLPDLEKARADLRPWAPLLFSPFVFSSEEFPEAEFEQPSLMEDALGPYTLQTTFYDASYNRVTRAQTPGRYGAVVEVKPENGPPFKRFLTVYRQDRSLDWNAAKTSFTGELPPELGVSPDVMVERADLWGRFLRNRLQDSFYRDPRSSALLAGFHEAKPGDGSAAWNNPYHRDETWWYGLKKKLGEVQPTRYLLDLPSDYDADPNRKWPVVIFLHGSGERGQDLEKLRRHGPPKLVKEGKRFPFILVSPQAPTDYLLGTQIIEVLDEVEKKYRVDADRVYLTGLSLGGNGTWFTALEFPERFAAIIPIAATGDPEGAARLKNLPTWYFVGGKDTNLSRERVPLMVEALKAAGVPFHFTLYPEAGHVESWEKAYSDPALYEWMLAQKRSP